MEGYRLKLECKEPGIVKVNPYNLHCMIAGKYRPLETVFCKTGTGAMMSASYDQTHGCTKFHSHCYGKPERIFSGSCSYLECVLKLDVSLSRMYPCIGFMLELVVPLNWMYEYS
jgi:hypothetical protein